MYFAMIEGQCNIPFPILKSRDGDVWLFKTRDEAVKEAEKHLRVGGMKIGVYFWPEEENERDYKRNGD